MDTESLKPISSSLEEMCMKKIVKSLRYLNELALFQTEIFKLLFNKLFNKGK